MTRRYRSLDLLHPDFRVLADRLLVKCIEARIMVMVVETWRSQASHEEDVKDGRSWTTRSKHQNTIGRAELQELLHREAPASLAIDIAPYDQYQLHGSDKLQWDADDPIWQKLGKIGESLGLKWGGRFKTVPPDMAHFEAPWA